MFYYQLLLLNLLVLLFDLSVTLQQQQFNTLYIDKALNILYS